MIQYNIFLHWSEDDGAYIAEVLELAGCMTYGATVKDAILNTEQLIQRWIETAQKLGQPASI